ncbi:MAG: tRNA epoxyqueuosine(34) reductase QueG [Alicyclobacillaceae bacterium]|nr:tRNA epoxyqueuosine(34) reductase QueG [Alicyclobacillaceae bacterium]
MTALTAVDVRRIGGELGFDAVGVTDAAPFPELVEQLHDYERRGLTGFEERDVQRRVHPTQSFPGAQAIVAVAMAYQTASGQAIAKSHPTGRQHGQMSVYVYGQDYHQVMKERLATLHERLMEFCGYVFPAHIAVDTSPLVDRRVAERAGIGWVGKNCMFFVPGYGSYVFLGSLVLGTPVDIEKQDAKVKHEASACHQCTLCLAACPTGALLAPGVIDATRCLSYITQMKGVVPREFRRRLGRRVFGCDTCQWACPENRGVFASKHHEFDPSEELAHPDLIALLRMTNRSFMRRYGTSAAAWRGLRTVQRNALIALGNAEAVEALPEMIPFLTHPRRDLRATAAWALGQFDVSEARQTLASRLHEETDEMVLEEIQAALATP